MGWRRALAGLLAVLGCSDSGTGPNPEAIPNVYYATTLTLTENGQTIDALEEGTTIDLVLNQDSTTMGSFFVPASLSEDTAYTVSLAGTWRSRGNSVTLVHDADTFLRDISLKFDGKHLNSTYNADGLVIHLTLSVNPNQPRPASR